ncbi:hypothetical protein FA09DRAFT_332243 [Tilletiopsis washingtonensis]|uniref:Uncharacterized protein n=1 Tax=Tilletiopsis washingtonensis TaxID=58919 RepID=A0A316Z1C3_9BASI|nr:hypothetical protein FA09DRAFT_332243 [Tilletiopsis washingtonensis]PWN95341.1 hypothetical protein FA09DRAFT_332243 [Tilletiopsis washingtonensis]
MIPLPGAGRRGDIAVDRARAAAAAAASASSSPPLDSYAAHAHAQLDALASGIGLSSQQQAAQQQQLSRRSRSPPASSAHASSSRLPTTLPSSGIFVPRTSRTSAGVRKPLSRCSESELEGISERADSLLRSAAVREKLAPAELERLRRDGEEARRRLEDIRRTKEEEKGRREEVRLVGRMEELELREESASPRLTNSPAMLYGRSPTSNYALGSSPTHTTEARRFVREREQSPTPGRVQLLSFQQASALERHTYEVQAAVERQRIEAATQRALARMGIKDDDAPSALPGNATAAARERQRDERERREQQQAEEEQEEEREEMEGEGEEYAEEEWARGIEI